MQNRIYFELIFSNKPTNAKKIYLSLTIVSMQMLNLLFVIVEIINVEIYLRLCSA